MAAAQAAVKHILSQLRAQGPKEARSGNQIAHRRALKSAGRTERVRVGEKGGFGHADLSIGRRHIALRRSDVGTAFEQLRRNGQGNRRGRLKGGIGLAGQRGDGEIRGRPAQQQRDGVLVLRALDANVRGLSLHRGEGGFGFGDVFIGINAGLEEDFFVKSRDF